MKNPWVHLAESPPYVLLDDRKYIDAFNRGEAERNPNPTTGLDLSLLPEPFVGNRRAPVVVLNLNPGWSLRDPENYSTPERRDAVWANLRSDEPDGQIHYAFTESFAGTPGGEYWRKCFRQLLDEGIKLEQLAGSVLSVEMHGYHSRSFAPIPMTLPSQRFAFHLVEQAIEREAVVVILRGMRQWGVVVPELRGRVVEVNNPRSATISRGNIGSDADWSRITRALDL